MTRQTQGLDRLFAALDRGLRTSFAASPRDREDYPAAETPESEQQTDEQRIEAGRLMRVNHVGEVCAQALYQGQAAVSRDPHTRELLEKAANEELAHLSWCEQRIDELDGRKSLLNPLWYAGAFGIGVVGGLASDKISLGFLAETEKQVIRHLDDHLERLPADDQRSRAIVERMKDDEAEHASTALDHGGERFPKPAQQLMQLASTVMTKTTYWV